MRTIYILLITFIFIDNCHSQALKSSFETYERLPEWYIQQLYLRNYGNSYNIDTNMNPFYLEADFNGQGQLDIAVFILEDSTNKKGILIQHKEDRTFYILGAGQTFNDMDNFSWLNVWKLYRKTTAERTIFTDNFDIEGSETVSLTNVAIQVAPSEGSYNLITWDGSKYI